MKILKWWIPSVFQGKVSLVKELVVKKNIRLALGRVAMKTWKRYSDAGMCPYSTYKNQTHVDNGRKMWTLKKQDANNVFEF